MTKWIIVIVMFIIVITLPFSCREKPHESTQYSTESVRQSTNCVYLVRHEGHEYLAYCQGGLVHSESCKSTDHVR